jgi:hypothetical protein
MKKEVREVGGWVGRRGKKRKRNGGDTALEYAHTHPKK